MFSAKILDTDDVRRYFLSDLKDKPSLVGYLVNVDAGRAPTQASPFMYPLSSPGVFDYAKNLVSTWNDIPRLQEYERSRFEKYGPQGWVYPLGSDQQITVIGRYYEDNRIHRPCYLTSSQMERAREKYRDAHLEPLTFEGVVQRQLEKKGLNTSAGAPTFKKRKIVVDESISLAEEQEKKCRAQGQWTLERGAEMLFPAILGFRCIRQAERSIFMESFEFNLRELRWIYPLMDHLKAKYPGRYSGWFGQEPTEEAINASWKAGQVRLSTDYEKMDTTFGINQAIQVYEVIKVAYPERYWEQMKWDLLSSFQQPVIIGALKTAGRRPQKGDKPQPKGALASQWLLVALTGLHSLFSGLGITQFFETEASSWTDLKMEDKGYTVEASGYIGDDGWKFLRTDRSLDQVAEDFVAAASEIGFSANAEKQLVSYDELHYLQRVYSPETKQGSRYRAAYPAVLAFNSAKNPERSRANLTGDEKAVRLIEICENCEGHPKFSEIVESFVRGDPQLQAFRDHPDEAFPGLVRAWKAMMAGGPLDTVGSNAKSKLSEYATVRQILGKKPLEKTTTWGESRILSGLDDLYSKEA